MGESLGFEDPSIWQIIASGEKNSAAALDTEVLGGYAVTSIGEGEVVNLDPTSFAGRRTFSQDAEGRISSRYVEFPAHPTLFRMGGQQPNRVSITFDDGPDPDWTPAILDILKERGVKAVFFVIGKNAELYPDLLRRIADEGHEIGNHSFTHANLRELPESLVNLELNATQRLIESLIGRSTALFRPPFNADAHPSDVGDLEPIRVAQSLGYMTVLENIDPCDWQEPPPEELLQRIKDKRGEGNIILLHDSGGDRSATVAALPMILNYLKERGDEVVPIGELVDINRDGIMPPVQSNSNPVAFFASGAGFSFLRVLQTIFFGFLIAASILVLLRTLIVLILAIRHRSQSRPTPDPRLAVSILIPAFNEEATVGRVVRVAREAGFPVVVADDGSKDETARRALEAGAEVVERGELLKGAHLLFTVQPPPEDLIQALEPGAIVVGFVQPHKNLELVRALQAKKATVIAMELIPRITRAQSMDALSSQATVAGYLAAIHAARLSPRFFPMLTTAAGTIRPAKVMVMGVGVAGLMAIATAKRLGAQVFAYDDDLAVLDEDHGVFDHAFGDGFGASHADRHGLAREGRRADRGD